MSASRAFDPNVPSCAAMLGLFNKIYYENSNNCHRAIVRAGAVITKNVSPTSRSVQTNFHNVSHLSRTSCRSFVEPRQLQATTCDGQTLGLVHTSSNQHHKLRTQLKCKFARGADKLFHHASLCSSRKVGAASNAFSGSVMRQRIVRGQFNV